MKQYQTRSTLKNNAKNYLDGKWGTSVLLILIMLAISLTLSYLMSSITSVGMVASLMSSDHGSSSSIMAISTVILYIASFLVAILNGLFTMGCFLFYLNIVSGQRYSIGDLFFAFRGNFSKNLTVIVATVLPQIVLMLPYNVCSYFFQRTHDFIWMFLTLVFLIVGIVIYVPIDLALSMSPMLLLDFPQYSAKEVLQHSIQIMKGNKGRLFLLELSFIPIYLLCAFSFAIGYLWAMPYMQMTYVLFYLDLMNPQVIETSPIYTSANA